MLWLAQGRAEVAQFNEKHWLTTELKIMLHTEKGEENMAVKTTTAGPPRMTSFMLSLTRILNGIFGSILRSPFHGVLSNKFLLLSFRGHKSGKQYTLLVGYVREGDELSIISPRGWWRNLREKDTAVRVLLQGKWRAGVAQAFYGNDYVATEFQRLAQKFPSLVRMYRIECDASGQPEPASVREATQKIAMIYIRLAAEDRA